MKKMYNFIPLISIYLWLGQFILCLQSYGQSSMNISGKVPDSGIPVIVSNAGWIVTADGEQGIISIAHDSLGMVMKEVRLNFKGRQGLVSLKGWSAEKTGDQQLTIQTIQPSSTWIFGLNQNSVTLSTTSTEMVLTAETPASTDRVVARVLDSQGVPVSWVGTDEVVNSFGGSETRNPSSIPARNPEVMTFALGQVSSSNLHSLFDRKKDIAIIFSDQTRMQRNQQQPDLLNITIPVPGNAIIRLIPDYYTKTLGLPFYSRFDDSVFSTAPIVWCSWTAYYQEARERDIVRNTDWLAANLKPYGFGYVQIDDGYDNGKEGMKHFWIDNWDKRALYPHGPQWIASYIKSKGLHPGLWLVPNSYAGAVVQHPDWYLQDKSGNFILDYSTPALDCTNPAVQDWLRKLFTTLKGWGFEYYKFDGEFALPRYAPDVDKTKLYDTSIDPIVAYRNRLKLIRDVIGPGTFVEGCPAGTPLNGIGYFNSSFCGHDVYNSWQGSYPLFSSINANAFLNHMVIYLMPGEGVDVSPPMSVEEAKQKMVPRFIEVPETREYPLAGYGVTMAEARTMVSYLSLTGVVYPLASIMDDLPEERARLLKMTMPTMPILPVDLFSRGTDMTWDKFKHTTPDIYIHNYPEILNLKVNANSGVYDVVGLTNWRSETVIREISFSDKLGLNKGVPYVVFDFWGQKLLGVFQDRIEIGIEPHDTRVLLVHPLLERPQLVGTSRHISGAFSILDLRWDDANKNLLGSSETVTGDTYSLFIYIPNGTSISQVKATTRGNREVPVSVELTGNLLKLSFQGQPEAVEWQVGFTTISGSPADLTRVSLNSPLLKE
jgi:hypothetical protein